MQQGKGRDCNFGCFGCSPDDDDGSHQLDTTILMYHSADMSQASEHFPTNNQFNNFLFQWCEIKNHKMVMTHLRQCITDMKKKCHDDTVSDSFDQINLNRLRELFHQLIDKQPRGDNATHEIVALLDA